MQRTVIVLALLCAASAGPGRTAEPAPIDAPAASLLLSALDGAAGHGFRPGEFVPGPAAAELTSDDPAIRGRAEARLSAAAVAYASAQHGGRIAPGRFLAEWSLRPPRYDAQAAFAAALAQHKTGDWLAELPPPEPRYLKLVKAYGRYRLIAEQGGWPQLADGPTLKLGATGERVSALRRRLAAEHPDLTPPAGPAPADATAAPYDDALAREVSRIQALYGLTPDGAVGPATLQALNAPVERRLTQIQANLERWRWMPRTLPPYRVELNIAAATLELYDGAGAVLAMKAIVGKPSRPTPMFRDDIKAVVLNPPWNVPPEIATKEIWPRIRRDPGYMSREGFVVRPGGGLQQLPGPKCALGTIKFDLSNSFGVYLHDTPARSLFARDARALSHGCMRLEQPDTLAKRLLKDDPDWPELRVDLAILAGATRRIVLARPAPVLVVYWSAFVDESGQANFRPDIYGWDAKLDALLSAPAA